ncbi:MAG: basic amino acid ABC transporter substrate-binding protein [Firmicutes bacterium]|jgi:polar amino acid transport system substrate-binding protein|nr:basic amino acid ABC transporter substrate-binding protein [Bacillota bacterium]
MKRPILICLLLIAGLLAAGCGGGKAGGVLTMGTNAEFAPFEFVDENNQIVGFDVDLASTIADKLGMKLEIQDMEFEGLVAAVASGRIDIAVAAMTITEERLEEVNFSDPYYIAGQAIVVPKDNTAIRSEADLLDKRVAVQLSTTGDIIVTEMGVPEEQIVRLQKVTHVFMELQNGRVDAIVIDIPVAERYSRNDDSLKIVSGNFEEEHYGIAVAKENEELLEQINDALRELKEDGTYDRLIEKWFEEEIGG